jgi:hypothetical protein
MKMPLFNTYIDKDHAKGWAMLVLAFGYLDAVVSEAELYDSPTSMCFHNNYIERIIVWAVAEQLIEPVGERGRFRLTDKGKQAWQHSVVSHPHK